LSNITTFKKGDDFEDRVFKIIKMILENDDFYVPNKKSRVFRKKGYYAKDRASNIIFDITIETFMDNSDEVR